MTPVASMTGFSTADGQFADLRAFSLTLKSVNHRHLDLNLRLPAGFDALEAPLRQLLKTTLRRGHVELTLQLARAPAASVEIQLDEALLLAYVRAHNRAVELTGLAEPPDVAALLRMPGVLGPPANVPLSMTEAEEPVLAAARAAVERLCEVRAAEGAALAAELRAAMQRLADLAEEARTLRAEVAPAQFARLRQKMADLVATVPEERLLAEAALLADRGDVEEELVRLRTHVARFVELLNQGGEVGKPLDFLLQELNREANTMLSKTGAAAGDSGLRLTEVGIAIKTELERAREQVQNLE